MRGHPGIEVTYTDMPQLAARALAECPVQILQHLTWLGGHADADTWTISVKGAPVTLRVAAWFALLGADVMPRPRQIDHSKPVVPLGTPPSRNGC